MRTRIVPTFVPIALALAAAACGSSDDTGGRTVVAAFYPLAFAAERVAAKDVEVSNLTPAGAEPHDLELTARDVERLRDADLVLHLGGFMPALDDAVDGHDNAVDLLADLPVLDGDDGPDPHVWLDPQRFGAIARRIAAELGDPEAATPLAKELDELDVAFRRGLARCERRTLVSSHAAFSYLADAYGLRQVALTGVSPEAEPSARAIERLVEEVERDGATTVFFETLVGPDLAETVAREAGVTTAVLNPLEGLTDDELAAGDDYFSVMRRNLATLRTALGCG